MTATKKAVALELAEAGADAFLRLSRGLPVLASEFADLSKAVGELGEALVAVPTPLRVDAFVSIPEAIADLETLAKQVEGDDGARLAVVVSKLRSFEAWRSRPALGLGSLEARDLESTQDRKEGVGVFLRVPPRIAAGFPSKAEDSSPAHATILMVGECSRDEFGRVVDSVRAIAREADPMAIELTDYGEFQNQTGDTIPHMIPRAEGASLEELHNKLRSEVEASLGRKVDHHAGPFKSHVTLAYVPKGETYSGPRPSGRFRANSLEVWGAPGGEFGRHVVELGSGDVLRELPATKRAGAGGETCTRCMDPIPCMHFDADGSLTETGRRANERVRARKDDGSGTSAGLAAANVSDLSTAALDARGGSLVPAQGGKKPKKLVESPPEFKGPRGEPGRIYPGDYLELPYYTVQATSDATVDVSMRKDEFVRDIDGQPLRTKKPGMTGPDIEAATSSGDAGGSMSASTGGVGMRGTAKTVRIPANELAAGIQTEMEHTSEPAEAARIALDHLREEPRYYSMLADCMNGGESAEQARKTLELARSRGEVPVPAEKSLLEVLRESFEAGTAGMRATLMKAGDEGEERTVLGIVLEPDTVDSQNDVYDEDEVRQSAWKFAERYQNFGLMHRQIMPGIVLLETWLSPVAFEILDREGKTRKIKKGTWLLRVRVLDDAIWAAVKAGELNGFSIGGSAMRRELSVRESKAAIARS